MPQLRTVGEAPAPQLHRLPPRPPSSPLSAGAQWFAPVGACAAARPRPSEPALSRSCSPVTERTPSLAACAPAARLLLLLLLILRSPQHLPAIFASCVDPPPSSLRVSTLPIRPIRPSATPPSVCPAMSLKVQTSNVTNKTDPKSLNSRVFIGNLNTAVVKKSDVESIFSKYGRVLGCSVHKGYAFVQYAGERHARGAVVGENGRVLAGQTLDINMAGDPRPNRAKGLKRSAASLYSGYEFDYDFYREDFYDRLFEFRGRVSPVPRVVPVKRPRVAVPLVRRVKSLPVKLLARNASVLPTSNGNPQKSAVRGTELQAIKSELTQIKANIEALLGRLEQITEDTRITATELRAADECKSEEAWQESGSEPEDEEQQRQNSEDGEEEEEQEEDEEEEEEGEHTQDDARDHMESCRLSSETNSIHP
uniref:RALY heterogeneous nuclear ribonucleoprotein n=1 Tax=Scophthalmus maximus TaxID=52904 RepID=A0A8D2ZGE7_SCOMX